MLGAVLGYSLSRRSVGQSLSQYFIFDGSSMFLAIAHVGNSFCCDPHLEPPTLSIEAILQAHIHPPTHQPNVS